MRFGYWMPVFGGWLRNVPDEGMDASWQYVSRLARRSEELGYDLTLIAELFLNDIKGIRAPALDAWSTAAALAAVTHRLELMVAVRPTFHDPARFAKQAANIDHISNGRLSLNVVSSWWKDEARRFGVRFDEHDDRYARTAEWLTVLDGAWREPEFSFSGTYYQVEDTIVEPKPVRHPRPVIYAGGESEAARAMISSRCDAYVMHGDTPEVTGARILDLTTRRARAQDAAGYSLPPLQFGMAAYVVVRDTEREARDEVARITTVDANSPGSANFADWVSHTRLEQQLRIEDYSVSNRGLRTGLVGTAEQVAEQLHRFERVGVNLLLLQCSPQLEEMERFAAEVMPLVPCAHGRYAIV